MSGLVTSMLHRTTIRILNGPTSVKLVGVNKVQGSLARKSVAARGVCRVLPFRGSLYILAVGNSTVGRLFRGVTIELNRKIDNVRLRVDGSNGLLRTSVTNGPIRSSHSCAITAVSCLTSKGSKVATFLRTSGERYPSKTALHNLFVGCIRGRATTNGGIASHVRKEIIIGRWTLGGRGFCRACMFLNDPTTFRTPHVNATEKTYRC